MPTYIIELRGTITRDIKWLEVEAQSEAEARAKAQATFQTYRMTAVECVSPSTPSSESTRLPNGSDES